MFQSKYQILAAVIGVLIFSSLFIHQTYLQTEDDLTNVEPSLVITRTSEGYVPKAAVVKKGDVVLWKNASEDYHWPASDLHPTHGIYPEFDPRRPVAPGEDWRFRFLEAGDWRFHDHLRANLTGVVKVVE